MRLLSFSGDSCRFGSPRSVRGPSCAYCPDCQNCLHDLRASHGQQRGVIPKEQSVVRDSDSRAKHTRRHQLDHERSKECNQQNAVGRRARPWGCRLGRRTCCWHSRSPNEAGIEAAPRGALASRRPRPRARPNETQVAACLVALQHASGLCRGVCCVLAEPVGHLALIG